MLDTDWSEYLKKLRERTGWAQSQFAKAIGVAPNTYYKWERGERPKPYLAENARRIEHALDDRHLPWSTIVAIDSHTGRPLAVQILREGNTVRLRAGNYEGDLMIPSLDFQVEAQSLEPAIRGQGRSRAGKVR